MLACLPPAEMPPQAIVKMLNEIYSLYDTLCEKYDLYKVLTGVGGPGLYAHLQQVYACACN